MEDALQLLIGPVEVPIRGRGPCVVQDFGGWQILLQSQEKFQCLRRKQSLRNEVRRRATFRQVNSHPGPAIQEESHTLVRSNAGEVDRIVSLLVGAHCALGLGLRTEMKSSRA